MLLNKKCYLSSLLILLSFYIVNAQKITYSEPDRDDYISNNFSIIGKLNNNYLIYKNHRGDNHIISVYDAQMKLVENSRLDFLPDKIISSEFLAYPNFCYMFYQYQRKSIVYSMAVKLDFKGKKISEPIQLDTTEINFFTSNKFYSVIFSEDKQKIMSFKVNNKNDKKHVITSAIFDKDLQIIHRSEFEIPMPERNDFLLDFTLDNAGTLYFLRAVGTAQNDNITKITLFSKDISTENIVFADLKLAGLFLDELNVKMDNYNHRFVIVSFYSKQRRGNVEGLYTTYWEKAKSKEYTNIVSFSDELRFEAKGDNNTKSAFNDYFLRSIILKRDGGFIVAAEASYTSTRSGINSNRWDYWGGNSIGLGSGYYSPSSWGGDFGRSSLAYPFGRATFNDVTRYYADNIAILSYDSIGKVEWTNIINKSQYDENADYLIGYTMVNTGDLLHFFFNVQEKRSNVLTNQSISPEGQINRNPTIKNLDKGYDFMPKYAKQVGFRQIIVPCQYRNYVCFAKIDIN
jgi:hypothetical protein